MRLPFVRRNGPLALAAGAAVVAGAVLLIGAAAAAGDTGAGRLAAEELGRGSPAIVLIHSIGGDRSDWARVAPILASRHRVILVDLPGHGQSPPPTAEPTVEGAAAAVSRTLAERRVEHAILVGHSYGALVALQAAMDQPKRVAAVVVVDASSFSPADSVRVAAATQVLRERYTVFLSAVYSTMSRDEARGESLMVRAMRVPQPVLTGYFLDAWREDLRPGLRAMKTPVHVIATEGMWPAGESWSSARIRLGYETAGTAQGYRVADSGHAVAADQPDSLAAIIESIASVRR
jgi:pimeloyl-ACP methyl ester carboxylesterase